MTEAFKRRRLMTQSSIVEGCGQEEIQNEKHHRRFRERIDKSWLKREFCDVALFAKVSESDSKELKKTYPKMCNEASAVTFHRNPNSSTSSEELLVEIHVHSIVVAAMSPTLHKMIKRGGRKGSIEYENEENSEVEEESSDREKGFPPKEAMKTKKDKEMILFSNTNVDGVSLVRLVRYIYQGTLALSSMNVEKTMCAAHFLEIKGAMELCADFYLQQMHIGNALSIASIGKVYECGDLEEMASTYVCDNFVAVAAGDEWLQLSKDDMEEILKMNDLVCVSEMDVIAAAYRWAVEWEEKNDNGKELSNNSNIIKHNRDAYNDNDSDDVGMGSSPEPDSVDQRFLCVGDFFRNGFIRLNHLSDEDLVSIKNGSFFDKEKQSQYAKEHELLLKECTEAVDMELQKKNDTYNRVKIDDDTDKDSENMEMNQYKKKLVSEPRKYEYVGGTRVTPHCVQHSLEGHDGYVYSVKEIDDGILVSGSRDQTINVWDINPILKKRESTATEQLKPILTVEGHRDRVVKLWSFENASKKILFASCSFDNTVRIWEWNRDQRSCTCVSTLKGHDDWVTSITTCFNKLVTGSADNTIKVWNIDSLECEKTITGHKDHVYGLCQVVKSDGTILLASGSQDKTVKIWDPKQDWKCVHTLKGHEESVRCVFPYRDMLITASADRMIMVWSTGEPWKMVKLLKGHSDVVEALVSMPRDDSNDYLVSASRDNSIKLWDVESARCQSTLTGHRNWVKGLAITRSGRLVSASADGTVKLWNTNT